MMHSGHGPFCNFLEKTLPDLSAFDPRAPESHLPQNQAMVTQVMSQAPPYLHGLSSESSVGSLHCGWHFAQPEKTPG